MATRVRQAERVADRRSPIPEPWTLVASAVAACETAGMPTISDRPRRFRALHERGCFVIPNPWDVGTTRYLQNLGFQAVATTSAGAAFSAGLPDTAATRDAMLAHIRTVVDATDLPVNADFEAGYAETPDAVAANVRLCVETGVAGLSIE